MARDYIKEITLVKERIGFNSRYELLTKLLDIETSIKLDPFLGVNDVFWKYVPISTIACIEEFFNSIVKELIDFGSPFSENVIKFDQNLKIKLTFEIVHAIQGRKITIGELIAHLLPHNNFDDLNSNISTIISKDFSSALREYKNIKVNNTLGPLNSNSDFNWDITMDDLKTFFELRHIFCHEFGNNVIIDNEKIITGIHNIKQLLSLINDFIFDLLYPSSPTTQLELNQAAANGLIIAQNKLTDFLNNTIKQETILSDRDVNHLNHAIDKWTEFEDYLSQFIASFYSGGSIYPFIYTNARSFLVSELIDILKKVHENYLLPESKLIN